MPPTTDNMVSPALAAPPPPRQRWRPSVLILASFGLHAGALMAWLIDPLSGRQLLLLLLINHLVLTLCGLVPRSRWLGPNLTRLPAAAAARGEVALTIDDGPDPEVTPAVLDLLDRHRARATFFCIGERAARHPALCREIVRRGHAVENHSQHHRHDFSLLGPGRIRRELRQAQECLFGITGQWPGFFRAPAGLRNPLLDPVLPGLGLRLASWTRRGFDTRNADPERLLRRLTDGLRAGDILLLHDGNAARTTSGQPAILAVLPALLQRLESEGLRTVTLRDAHDPQDTMTTPAPKFIKSLVDRAAEPYRSAGRYAWQFARGKLGGDPAFAALLSRGLLAGRTRILDIGCGQGLLTAWLLAARQAALAGEWPAGWPTAPAPGHVRGIELMQHDVNRAEQALQAAVRSGQASFVAADMCQADFGRADAVVILDVLHYVPIAAQDEVLRRVRAALDPDGVLLLRVGDASGGLPFRISNWVDFVVTTLRGHRLSRLYCRPLAEWKDRLSQIGFEVEAQPMSEGTPFANVMLVARVKARSDALGAASSSAPAVGHPQPL